MKRIASTRTRGRAHRGAVRFYNRYTRHLTRAFLRSMRAAISGD